MRSTHARDVLSKCSRTSNLLNFSGAFRNEAYEESEKGESMLSKRDKEKDGTRTGEIFDRTDKSVRQ